MPPHMPIRGPMMLATAPGAMAIFGAKMEPAMALGAIKEPAMGLGAMEAEMALGAKETEMAHGAKETVGMTRARTPTPSTSVRASNADSAPISAISAA